MLKQFYPYEYVESVFSIDYRKLYDKGYRGLIFDIDNTLVHHGEDSTPEVDALFRHIHQVGLKTILLSNNSEARILRFLKNIDSMYIAEAGKPDTAGYEKAIQMLDVPKDQCLCIGDQFFATTKKEEPLENLVSEYRGNMIKRAPGVNLDHQENKAVNIALACSKINGIVIRPGEEFSFWKLVGKTSRKNGYKEGRIIRNNKLVAGTGGGLCNLGNTIHLLVLHSPLTVTEFHKHSDALAPDEGKRVPLSAGTSVSYNNLDFRFKNETDQEYQLLAWCEGEFLHAQLRSEKAIPYRYELMEEDHHFRKEGEKYFRVSKIYRQTWEKTTGEPVEKKLIVNNHSEVMFDHSLIPPEQIRE